MRVLFGITVTGEMLARGEHAVLLNAAHEIAPHHGHQRGIFAHRTCADDRVLRIVVDIQHGRERHVDAHRASFLRGDAPHLVREHRVACRAECHLVWERRGPTELDGIRQEPTSARPERRPRLEVGTDQQGQTRGALEGIHLHRDIRRPAHGHDHPTEFELADKLLGTRERSALDGREVAECPDPDELRGLLPHGQRLEHRVGPAFVGGRIARAHDAAGNGTGGGRAGRRRGGSGAASHQQRRKGSHARKGSGGHA